MRGELGREGRVILRVHDHRHIGVVLGGAANHGRPADIDILDAIREGGLALQRLLEGIEIDHEKIDRRDPMGEHRGLVLGVLPDREEAAMHLGMERLEPAVHHLGKARQLRDVDHLKPGFVERLRGATRRDERNA